MEEDNYSFEDLIRNQSFRRWVEGTASQQERQYWDRWIMRDQANRTLASRAQKHVAGFSINPASRPSQLRAWRQLQDQMDIGGSSYKKYVSATSRNSRLRWMFRAAAGFLLIAMTGLFVSLILNDQAGEQRAQIIRNEIMTDYGERKTIGLSDGSEIVLNAHSSLVYTVGPADSNAVEVFLDGEALFSVAERQLPDDTAFRVKTAGGVVKVMGTRFVVSTRNSRTQVVLEEGKVALRPLNRDNETILKPGQLAEFGSYADADTVLTKFVNPEVYTSWSTYTLVFDRTSFAEIADRLEATFGVKVVVREPRLYKRKITGSVDNSSLEVIASALSNALGVPIQVTDKAMFVGEKR